MEFEIKIQGPDRSGLLQTKNFISGMKHADLWGNG